MTSALPGTCTRCGGVFGLPVTGGFRAGERRVLRKRSRREAGSGLQRAESLETGGPLLGPGPVRRQMELASPGAARHATGKVEEPSSDRL